MRAVIRIIYISLIVLSLAYLYNKVADTQPVIVTENVKKQASRPVEDNTSLYEEQKNGVVLDVAYASEAPEGKWVQPWANACEEATILIADMYYKGVKSISVVEAKSYLQFLFDREDEMFGSNRNADSSQMMAVISKYAGFRGRVVDNPSLDDLRGEIRAGRPIISLHYGFDLKNPNIEFSPTLSSYHTIVIVGFDDEERVFITHDPGDDVDGAYHEYSYNTIMNSMHDYDGERNKADGMPRVIFTDKK